MDGKGSNCLRWSPQNIEKRMKDFLKKIVVTIVENPDQIEISSAEGEGATIYTVLVPEAEVGKVIGKEGKVITAIRCLARLKALKNQEKVLIKVEGKVF